MDVVSTTIAFSATRGYKGPKVFLVRVLIGRKANIAVNPENAIAWFKSTYRFIEVANACYQLEHKMLKIGLGLLLAMAVHLKPLTVIVV